MIEVKNLTKVFTKEIKGKGIRGYWSPEKKEFVAVNNIDLSVKKGEVVAFVGPNGAGKSTTIKILTGIVRPTEGEITVAGLNPVTDRKALDYKIGCMFGQKSGLWMHLPAIDTYKLLGAIYDIPDDVLEKRVSELIKEFEIEEIINTPVRKLSLGQRMICEIVAIMLHEPEILFLDEPTIGLDIVMKEKVRNAILNANKKHGTTIFLTSHDLGDIEKICDRIVIIDKGVIIKDESIEQLKSEFLTEKLITITYQNNVQDIEFGENVISHTSNKVLLRVDTKLTDISEVLAKYMKYGNIVDLETTSVPLEEVIYDIYTKRGD